jgi:hypothetical protein
MKAEGTVGAPTCLIRSFKTINKLKLFFESGIPVPQDAGSPSLLLLQIINLYIISIGGAHQQTSERAAPPVSVEEKGKATRDKIKMLLFLLMSIQY